MNKIILIAIILSVVINTIFAFRKDELWAFGEGDFGQFARSNLEDQPKPGLIRFFNRKNWDVRCISANRHVLLVGDNGEAWSWGIGSLGQLGQNSTAESPTPAIISLFDGKENEAIDCSAGKDFSLLLASDGTIWSFGSNGDWLGLGGIAEIGVDDVIVPKKVVNNPGNSGDLPEFTKIYASIKNSMAVTKTGELWVWGESALGPYNIGGDFFPVRVDSLTTDAAKIIDFCGGEDFSLAVGEDGRVWSWGQDLIATAQEATTAIDNPRLIPFFDGKKVISVACGQEHSLFVTDDGMVYAAGKAAAGRLGLGDNTADQNTPIAIPVFEDLAPTEARIVSVAAGLESSFGIAKNGTLWSWGSGQGFRLGHGDIENRGVPTVVIGLDRGSPFVPADSARFSAGDLATFVFRDQSFFISLPLLGWIYLGVGTFLVCCSCLISIAAPTPIPTGNGKLEMGKWATTAEDFYASARAIAGGAIPSAMENRMMGYDSGYVPPAATGEAIGDENGGDGYNDGYNDDGYTDDFDGGSGGSRKKSGGSKRKKSNGRKKSGGSDRKKSGGGSLRKKSSKGGSKRSAPGSPKKKGGSTRSNPSKSSAGKKPIIPEIDYSKVEEMANYNTYKLGTSLWDGGSSSTGGAPPSPKKR